MLENGICLDLRVVSDFDALAIAVYLNVCVELRDTWQRRESVSLCNIQDLRWLTIDTGLVRRSEAFVLEQRRDEETRGRSGRGKAALGWSNKLAHGREVVRSQSSEKTVSHHLAGVRRRERTDRGLCHLVTFGHSVGVGFCWEIGELLGEEATLVDEELVLRAPTSRLVKANDCEKRAAVTHKADNIAHTNIVDFLQALDQLLGDSEGSRIATHESDKDADLRRLRALARASLCALSTTHLVASLSINDCLSIGVSECHRFLDEDRLAVVGCLDSVRRLRRGSR